MFEVITAREERQRGDLMVNGIIWSKSCWKLCNYRTRAIKTSSVSQFVSHYLWSFIFFFHRVVKLRQSFQLISICWFISWARSGTFVAKYFRRSLLYLFSLSLCCKSFITFITKKKKKNLNSDFDFMSCWRSSWWKTWKNITGIDNKLHTSLMLIYYYF